LIDYRRTIISQYANSPTLIDLVDSMDTWIDPSKDVDAWYDYVWSVDTARGFGLDIWGRIVGIRRVVTVPATPDWFGFAGQPEAKPFNQAPFWAGAAPTSNYEFDDVNFRKLILVKAASNIALSTSPAINAMLRSLFDPMSRGRAYVNDLGSMTMRFTFEFALEPAEVAMLTSLELLPRPTGVLATIFQPQVESFAFNEAGEGSPFNQAPFGYPAETLTAEVL
jgi:hypothetical protein